MNRRGRRFIEERKTAQTQKIPEFSKAINLEKWFSIPYEFAFSHIFLRKEDLCKFVSVCSSAG